jgi:hypothetical protein
MDSVLITVRWPGIQPMAREGTHYRYKPQNAEAPSQRHGNANHFVRLGMRLALERLFADYFSRYSVTARPFVVNDAGLAPGGLFDIDRIPWRPPHRTHRRGTNADVSDTTMSRFRWTFFATMCLKHGLVCDAEHDRAHFHVRVPSTSELPVSEELQ